MTGQEFTIVLIAMVAEIAVWTAFGIAFFLHQKRFGLDAEAVFAAILCVCVLTMFSAFTLGPLIDSFT